MIFRGLVKLTGVVFVLLLALGIGVSRAAADPILDRLQVINGYVVQVDARGIVIDCGAAKGTRSGDVFGVVRPGAPLVHPATGQVIGRRDEIVSLLKAVRVEPGFAVMVPLSRFRGVPVLRGQMVRRAAGQRVLFIDRRGDLAEVYSAYRERLPHLVWAEYHAGRQPQALAGLQQLKRLGYDLYLVADGRQVQLFNADGELMAALDGGHGAALDGAAAGGDPGGVLYDQQTGKRAEVLIPRHRRVGIVNRVVYSLDMGDVTGDRHAEMVFSDGQKIFVYRVTPRGLKYLYRYYHDTWGNLLNVQLADIDGDHRAEILVNVIRDSEDGFSSFVIGFKEGKFRPVAQEIPFLLGMVGGSSVAQGGVFLGQEFADQEVFGDVVYQLRLAGDGVERGEPFAVPQEFRLPGALYDDVNGDGQRELCFINGHNHLEIYRGSERLWISDERLGGSLNVVQVEVGTGQFSYTAKYELSPALRFADVDGNGKRELLVVRNISAASTAVGDFGFLHSGEVVMLQPMGSGFTLRSLTGELEGPIQGLNLVGDELLVAMVKRGDDLLKATGDTYLLAFPLLK